MSGLDVDLAAFTRLAAALAEPDADRRALLAEHDLDEAGYDALDAAWAEALARAEDAHGDREGVPPLVLAHAQGFAAAQRALAGELLSFERYLEITRALRRGRDIATVLERFSVSLSTYLQSHQEWTIKLAGDAELAEAFRRAIR